eukprot:85731-Pyramimonas_sp.AAC.1
MAKTLYSEAVQRHACCEQARASCILSGAKTAHYDPFWELLTIKHRVVRGKVYLNGCGARTATERIIPARCKQLGRSDVPLMA